VKFLVDQQFPHKLVALIQQRGHEALHVKDLSLEAAEDRIIWREAARIGAIIISKDEDFSLIPRVDGSPQVVWVRTGNCPNSVLLARFEHLWNQLIVELEKGTQLVELR
jgi:predicted nuclease of predicted toxin-antitoxin system